MVDKPSVLKYIDIFFGGILLLSLIFIYNNSMIGLNALVYGGYEGILLIAISIILLNYLKIKLAIIIGVIGSILLGINVIFLIILNFLDISRFQILFGFYFGLVIWIILLISHIILIIVRKIKSEENEMIIRKTILDLGIKFPRLKVKQIAEKCKRDLDIIIGVVKEMVKNQEIYGEYFVTSRSVVFNQQANLEEIDILMAKFEDWEQEKIGKRD